MVANFVGIYTPLITPIHRDQSPDLASLERLVSFQLRQRVHGLWAMGTSAEFASFTSDERASALSAVVRAAGGTVPVIANISDASTRLAVAHGKSAQAAGVSAIAATPPYYYPHSQDELVRHYSAIRESIDLPLFIYNIPQTVRVRVELQTVRDLASGGVVDGIKDSQNDLDWLRQLVIAVRHVRPDFALFAGTRFLIDAAVLVGATGAIPSVANAFPDLCVKAFEAACTGRWDEAAAATERLLQSEAFASSFRGGSRNAIVLGVLKTLLQSRGIIESAALTEPLRSLVQDERTKVVDALADILPSSVGQ